MKKTFYILQAFILLCFFLFGGCSKSSSSGNSSGGGGSTSVSDLVAKLENKKSAKRAITNNTFTYDGQNRVTK